MIKYDTKQLHNWWEWRKLIYVWAFEQDFDGQGSINKNFKEEDVMVPWYLSFKYEADLKKDNNEGLEVNKEGKLVVYKLYYHFFKEGELDSLLKQH